MDPRFEVVESDQADYLAVLDFLPHLYGAVESHDGGYRPRVYESDGIDNLDTAQLVASGEVSYDVEQAASDVVRLAGVHCRLLARACEPFPAHLAEAYR